jgi:hypothetical protein
MGNENGDMEPLHEQLVIHPTYWLRRGKLTLEARCMGSVEFNGKVYEFNRVIKFRATRETPEHERNLLAHKARKARVS